MVHPVLLYLQIALTAVIIGAVSLLYRRICVAEARFKLRFLIAAFIAFLMGLLFHIVARWGYQPNISVFLEHVFGVVFFLFFGATGLLHFLEKERTRMVVATTYLLTGIVIALPIAVSVYYFSKGMVYQIGARAVIIAHSFQILILLVVTGIIIWRIYATHSSMSLRTLHRRYPFGIAAALMMFAVAAHILGISTATPFRHLSSFFESILVLPALLIVAFYILLTFKNQVQLFGAVEEIEEDKHVEGVLENLNHIIRHVYYTPVDIGIGAREVLFSEFLESANLTNLFSKSRMELRRDEFLRASEDSAFLYNLSHDMLMYFETHKDTFNDAQFHRLTEFLNAVYTRSIKNEDDFKAHWVILSRIAKTLGTKADKHLERLSNWDPETTLSYFKAKHPTGIRKLDMLEGGLETHQFLLNVSEDVPKLKILHPVIKSCLSSWRNLIYITSDPVAKIEKELGGEMAYLERGRLRLMAFLPKKEAGEEKGVIMASSPMGIIKKISESLDAFPLGTTFIVIDMNPLAISYSSSEVHGFIKQLSELRYKDKLVLCTFVSSNIPPLSMDILREEADVVIHHKLISGDVSSVIVKPEMSIGEPLEKDLFRVLQFVYHENSRGRKPSIGEISSKISITPKTAKKRVVMLREKGLISIERWGRYKVIEITEDGRQAFLLESSSG